MPETAYETRIHLRCQPCQDTGSECVNVLDKDNHRLTCKRCGDRKKPPCNLAFAIPQERRVGGQKWTKIGDVMPYDKNGPMPPKPEPRSAEARGLANSKKPSSKASASTKNPATKNPATKNPVASSSGPRQLAPAPQKEQSQSNAPASGPTSGPIQMPPDPSTGRAQRAAPSSGRGQQPIAPRPGRSQPTAQPSRSPPKPNLPDVRLDGLPQERSLPSTQTLTSAAPGPAAKDPFHDSVKKTLHQGKK